MAWVVHGEKQELPEVHLALRDQMCCALGVLIPLTSYNGSLGWLNHGDVSIQDICHELE